MSRAAERKAERALKADREVMLSAYQALKSSPGLGRASVNARRILEKRLQEIGLVDNLGKIRFK